MAAEGDDSLESYLNKATNPSAKDEDWEAIMAFCDQINKELEGPQIAVRLLSHKIQSPQEREALFALTTLESCVKNCGQRFHQEIGKFRFLNEVIKVVSPKYLGSYTTEKVKKKCVEILYSWSENLKQEQKIKEAYTMLKKQGIVKEDPSYIDQTFEPPPPPREKDSIFDDEDKSKQLARLLKSKNAEDLQAANRLIKNMVKQDMERMEKQSKRTQELETVNNNVKLLTEMLQHYSPGNSTESDQEILKELYESLEKRRPNLFRLASDADDKDNDAMSDILKTNDDVVRVMTLYQKVVEGKTEENGLLLLSDGEGSGAESQQKTKTDMEELGNIFGATPKTNNTESPSDLGLLDLNLSSGSQLPVNQPSTFQATTTTLQQLTMASSTTSLAQQHPPLLAAAGISASVSAASSAGSLLQPMSAASGPYSALSTTSQAGAQGDVVTGILAPKQVAGGSSEQPSLLPAVRGSAANSQQKAAGISELDQLGQSLLKQSLGNIPSQAQSSPATKLSLNQIPTATSAAGKQQPQQLLNLQTPAESPVTSLTSSPAKTVSIEPLTGVHVALESVQPGTEQPVTAYDKNNIKVMLHFGKERPRPDVLVVVVSTISTNSHPVKKFQFQAAVPKIMKVKLQTASATDLPAFNPILPAAAITQVMLVANPQKENIKLKYKITYTINENNFSDVGDVENFPVS